MLRVSHVSKSFGGTAAVQDCSFSIESGSITALIGPNGAGKTTILDILSGFITADQGTIELSKQSLQRLSPHQRANKGMLRTWQQVRLFHHLTIADHLAMAESSQDTSVLRALFGAKPQSHHQQHRATLRQYGINHEPSAIVSELSYGQRKLLQLAMVVVAPHKILLLDEPVAGVNLRIQNRIEQLLLSLKQVGETVVVIEHDMEFVKKLADQVIVLDQGKVIASGPPEKALKAKQVLDAYLGR